ncbi:MAG: ABC transporter permease [Chloroflexi bacterium]|nr:ABC transporter permease [Chloroflexota bacterium]
MIPFVLRRMGTALVVAWLALTLAFVVLRWAPGDAVDATLARSGGSAEEIAARRAALGLDDPVGQQYLAYLAGLVRGDLGESLISGQPVSEMLADSFVPTATLSLLALVLAVALGVLLGVLAGAAPYAIVRAAADGTASLALSTPVYWTATLAIYLFTVVLGLLPGVGGTGPRYLILPAGVLGFHTAGSIARVTASSIRESAGQDFVRTAQAKGLPDAQVLDHILRVGLLPVVAVVALQLGFLLGGTVITEIIFVRRGLGRVLILAVNNRDYPVIQGLVVLAAVTYSLVNALADVVYSLVDPRVRSAD